MENQGNTGCGNPGCKCQNCKCAPGTCKCGKADSHEAKHEERAPYGEPGVTNLPGIQHTKVDQTTLQGGADTKGDHTHLVQK